MEMEAPSDGLLRIVFGRSGRKLRDVGTARPSWFRIQCHNEGGIAFHLQSPRSKRIELVNPSECVVGDERQSEWGEKPQKSEAANIFR